VIVQPSGITEVSVVRPRPHFNLAMVANRKSLALTFLILEACSYKNIVRYPAVPLALATDSYLMNTRLQLGMTSLWLCCGLACTMPRWPNRCDGMECGQGPMTR
jgi:hypothetical protein